jgi:hypothetical protein
MPCTSKDSQIYALLSKHLLLLECFWFKNNCEKSYNLNMWILKKIVSMYVISTSPSKLQALRNLSC